MNPNLETRIGGLFGRCIDRAGFAPEHEPAAFAWLQRCGQFAAKLASLTIRGSVLLVLMGLLTSSVLSADDAIDRIARAWNKHYATFAQSDQYHYRCALTQRRKKAELTWNQVPLPESTQFVVEVFRLGPATRMDLASGGDFSAIDESGWIQIFDGRAGYVIQDACQQRCHHLFRKPRHRQSSQGHGTDGRSACRCTGTGNVACRTIIRLGYRPAARRL